LTILSRY